MSEIERVTQAVEVERGCGTLRCLLDHAANVVSQHVAVADVEAQAARRRSHAAPRLAAPIFRNLRGCWLGEAHAAAQVLAEEPAAVLVHDRDLVVAQTVQVILGEQRAGVVDQKLPDLGLLVVEHQAAGVAVAREVLAARVVTWGLAIEKI